MKVDFVIAGAQKCGTTTLHRLLSRHPEIHMAPVKGTHFFDTEENFSRAEVDYAPYHAQFTPRAEHRLVGEATPIYSFWEPAARRLWEYHAGLKVIVVLRNPIDRAYSHWNMERSRRAEPLDFEEALDQEESRARAALPLQDRVFSYVARGFYSEQLRRLARFFPAPQRLVLPMEDLVHPDCPAAGRIWTFLGLDRPAVRDPIHANRRSYPETMAAATRRRLAATFEPEIRELERTLGWDLASWRADESSGGGGDDRPRLP